MKNYYILALFMAVVFSCKSADKSGNDAKKSVPADPTTFANTITQSELKEMLYVYASDEFKGRMTGEEGEQLAVDYLKNFYGNENISSAVKSGDYVHPVPLNQLFTPDYSVSINSKSLKAFDEVVSMSSSVSGDVKANEIVYVGYGIDHENYSDFKNIDVAGKIVLAKSGEPQDENGNYLVSGTSTKSKWSNGRQGRRSKRDAASAKGAKAFIFVDDAAFNYYSKAYKRRSESGTSLGLSLDTYGSDMLFFLVNQSTGGELVNDLQTTSTPKVIPMDIELSQKSASKAITAKNVVAFIKGSEKPDEYIVISAHLDHVGLGENGEVYNGADDDGSGTVAILEIAEAFNEAAKKGQGPKRSIVFLHVTGEERGLLGSRYYTDIDPVFPLENTVANLNIDMIGRTDPKRTEGSRNYVYLIGSDKLSTELHDISEQVNTKYTNIELDYKYNDDNDPNRFYYRSDHYNFAKNNIPVIFYFNGTHDDYHQPGDTPDKIQYDLLENRAKLVFYTAWELANRDKRIVVDKAEEEQATSGN